MDLSFRKKNDSSPLYIDAQKGIKIFQQENIAVAYGKPTATQGDVKVSGNKITAYYRERPGGGDKELYKIIVIGRAKIKTPTETAYGEKAIYYLDTSLVELIGRHVKFISPDYQIYANKRLEYWQESTKAVAKGKAKFVQKDREIEGDTLIANFKRDKQDKLVIDTLDSKENVTIITEDRIAKAKTAKYKSVTDTITMYHDVHMSYQEHHLHGEYGVINRQSGVSEVYPFLPKKKNEQGRVQILIATDGARKSKIDGQKEKS